MHSTQPKTSTIDRSLLAGLNYVLVYLLRPLYVVRGWQRRYLWPDLMAGITVGLIALPQSIAFALIADLPPEMGLYATVVAAIVGALWGSADQIQTGPANAISILVFSVLAGTLAPGSPEFVTAAGVLAVMAGVIQLVVGLARLGLLVNFVAHPVIVGFATGAAVLIGIKQVRHLLGLSFTAQGLPETLQAIVLHLPETHWPTMLLGLGTIGLLLLLRKINNKLPGPLIALVVASGLVYLLHLDRAGVSVIGKLPTGLPPLAALPLTDLDLIGRLSTGALAVAAIGLIQTTAIARSISSQTGQRLDNNQEFVGQGLANIAAGLFSGYAGAASFARSAVSLESGARTALSAIFAGLLVLAPLAVYLPRPALAGVLVVIAYRLIKWPEIYRIWRGAPGDALIMLITTLGTLFLSMEFAVLAGILLSFTLYLIRNSLPQVYPVVTGEAFKHFVADHPGRDTCSQLGVIEISGDLYFGAANHIEDKIINHLADHPRQRFLLLRMQGVNQCDISGVHMLEDIRQACLARYGDLFLMKVQKPVITRLQTTGFYQELGADHFLQEEQAISYLFYKVLTPAICIYECQRRAFYECQNLPKRRLPEGVLLDPPPAAQEIVPTIPAEQLWDRLHNGQSPPLVIDVREPREYQRGHIAEAILKPLFKLPVELADIPSDRPLVLVCRSGRRSRQAAHLLQKNGYTDLHILQGGMLAWEAQLLLEAVDLPLNGS